MLLLLRVVAPPMVALLAGIALWQGCVTAFDVPKYLLPSPVQVAKAIADEPGKLVRASLRTGLAAVAALGVSVVVGLGVGFLFSQSVWIRRSFYPYAIFLQTVPIIAIAPLIVLWFGYGFGSVVAVAVVISLFPMITSATTGLTSLDPLLVDLFTMHRASRCQFLWKLRLPSAVPYLLPGAKTSSGLAVIGAIVGEFFTGYGVSDYGLGFLIRVTADQSRTDDLFAAVLASTVLGVLIFGSISSVGAIVFQRWYDSAR